MMTLRSTTWNLIVSSNVALQQGSAVPVVVAQTECVVVRQDVRRRMQNYLRHCGNAEVTVGSANKNTPVGRSQPNG
jgi:hypothetical protein